MIYLLSYNTLVTRAHNAKGVVRAPNQIGYVPYINPTPGYPALEDATSVLLLLPLISV